mmetsp:Transcript_17116/g.27769  ORF Transcript_17116/g.27769 Transcript_17116/m.27769 type:complete len:86 (+) Transcript_17116:1307-1564(+)
MMVVLRITNSNSSKGTDLYPHLGNRGGGEAVAETAGMRDPVRQTLKDHDMAVDQDQYRRLLVVLRGQGRRAVGHESTTISSTAET